MAKVDPFYDSDAGFYGGNDMHPERWRVHGNKAQMIDAGEHGPLSPATDDNNVNTCKKKEWPDAPGFKGGSDEVCETGSLSGAFDGAASSA